MKKRIAILGSTGSIGTQALEVIQNFQEYLEPIVLTAQNNADLLIKQAIQYRPKTVIIGNTSYYNQVSQALKSYQIKVLTGTDSISEIVESDDIDLVLIAIVGFAGLLPTLKAIASGKQISLANKEVLVVAGEIVTKLAREKKVNIYPVDSEHSAIFQCLVGEKNNSVEKIYLTASGGPFRGKTADFLKNVTKDDALKHPNWNMGQKITIDSATLMNKGLEVIEAKWLFDLTPEQIEVLIHPQSVIHSMVQFKDGSLKAQMGLPDMKLPILYSFSYPDRFTSEFPRLDFVNYPQLTFESPDIKNFRNLVLAYESINKGGNMPCILNAANECVIQEFLHHKISFLKMPDIIEKCMQIMTFIKNPSYESLVLTDKETREIALKFIKN